MTYTVKNVAKISQWAQWKHTDKQVRDSWLHYLLTISFILFFFFFCSMTSIQQYVGVQFQNNPTTVLFETNYIRQFANIEVITLLILTSGLKRVLFLYIFLYLFWKEIVTEVDVHKTNFKIQKSN